METDLKPLLRGARVALVPLERQHRDALVLAAADGKLWDLRVTTVPDAATIDAYIETALAGREAGTVIPFVTTIGEQVAGSTRFWKLDRRHRQVEIGHTWIGVSWQGGYVNTEAKFLMLQFAFERLGCIRVQFTTDVLNERSRQAILRLGAVEEGVIRNERIMPDGRKRNSLRFSIIDTEWEAVKQRLSLKLA